MRNSSSSATRLVEAAAAEAVSAARWERIDLETRRPDCVHRELILAKAAELAMSPVARDQLMSLALERSAEDGLLDGPLIDVLCACGDRARIVERIVSLDAPPSSDTDALVLAVEERHARHLRPRMRTDLLSHRLEQDAALQESLWDHPDLPASDTVRLAMLSSVARLRDRARNLSASTPVLGGWPPLGRWLAAASRRVAR